MNKAKINFILFGIIIVTTFYLVCLTRFAYYWHDEIIVLRHLSGYSQLELVEDLYDGQPKSQQDLHKFQTFNEEKSLHDSLNSVTELTPDVPPLYVILLSIWAKIFGNHELVFRSLSLIIYGIFIFCSYHLALVLFDDHRNSLIATILTALSPRFIGYGLGVWEYSLFSLLITLSSLLLLKSLAKHNSFSYWLSYGFSLVAGLYTHIFFILIALAHFIYIMVNRSLIYAKDKTYFLKVWIFSVCMYLPWIIIMVNNQASIYFWAKVRWSLTTFLNRWLSYIPYLFSVSGKIFSYIFTAFVFFSLYYLVKRTEQKIWSFIVLLTAVPFLSLAIYDICLGTRYSSVGRFYLSTFIGILLSVSFLISQGLGANNQRIRIISYIFVLVLIFNNLYGKVSYLWGETKFRGHGSMALNSVLIVNQTEQPLVVGEDWLDILTFSHKAKDNTNYLLIDSPEQLNLSYNYSDIFIISPSSSLREQLIKRGISLTETNNKTLWKIKK